jgi:hypothetical protein
MRTNVGGGMRRAAALAVVMAALAAAPAMAFTPSGTYRGKTAQKKYKDHRVVLKATATTVTSLNMGWRAKCQKPGKYWFGGTKFRDVAIDADTKKFDDAGTYGVDTGKYHGEITVSLHGRFTGARHARGKLSASVKVTRRSTGEQVDTCSLSTKWSAKRPKHK